jgi:hypothetical protein
MINLHNRLNRELIALADLDDDGLTHEVDDRAKVSAFTRALRSAAAVPPLFVIRQNGKLTLIQGCEQTAAADKLGIDALPAIVFDAHCNVEADCVGAVGFDLAESGCDIWAGLERAYGVQHAA